MYKFYETGPLMPQVVKKIIIKHSCHYIHMYVPRLKQGWIIQDMFCLGQVGLTHLIKINIQILYWITCVDNSVWC